MQRILKRVCLLLTVVYTSFIGANAQVDTIPKPTSIDPNLIIFRDATRPKQYTIASIKTTGVFFLDSAIVASISGLQVGDKILHPGGDEFPKAIQNLWKQRLFSNVEIFVTKIDGDNIDIEIQVMERARLANWDFKGDVKKSEEEELVGKIGLAKQTIVTENTRRTADEVIKKYYGEKGYLNVKVKITEKPDTSFINSIVLLIEVDKGNKVKVNNINFFGNETVTDLKLKKQLKGTKEVSRFTLYPKKDSTLFGENPRITFRQYMKDKGFLSISKTKSFLDPWFRFKLFSSAKFNEKKFEEDKEKIIEYYNSIGYRDAIIEDVKPYPVSSGNINIDFKMSEGHKYYFGNITWKGNSKYNDSILNVILGINKGDVYNIETLNQRLGKQLTPEGGDISGLYMDDGYLFFRAEAVETAVYNDTIDHEIRIIEGPQARIKNIKIFGNDRTKEHVIRRELRTIPGELFSRADLIRSQRELGQLNYFNQETIGINPIPNPEDGTVDIHYKLEEKSSDQLELSAGWGGGIGLTGTLGVSFNNFSIKNIFNKKSWDPLPTGDGQKLSLRVQSNGRIYSSYNASFTEPWLGGKKRNSLTFSLYKSKFTNGYDYLTQRFNKERADSSYLKTLGASVSLGKQLKWPDDYFSLIYTLNFTQYKLLNYPIFAGLDSGNSTNFSLKIALQRNSAGPNPIFPTSGSSFLLSVQATPPYSIFNPELAKDDSYKHPEYHKWRFNAEWYVPLGKPMGADKNRQFVVKLAAKYGFMGKYNNKLAVSPFERFQLGDAGMANNFGLLGYDIIAHRGYPIYENSNPGVNPSDDPSQARNFFTIFNKYQVELRYPFATNPQSTIYGLAFFEAANGWYSFKDYNPFRLRRSAGVGMRFFLPMFGLLGFDYGIGFDRIKPGQGLKSASKFTFMLGYEPE
jgi:outer membrane protein insertion porin family